ncbi:MAG: glycosyltransferase [Alphaproteobacteria bacterium]|nr:glycosyltransferase [Alphaproteobacteria bacterium]
MASRPVRILHAHSTFSLGGKEARAVVLMNALGERAEHVVITSMPGEISAREAIAAGTRVAFPADAPALAGPPSPARLLRLARYMRGFDLVLSYNWGAFDAVMARRLFGSMLGLPPLIHHEDGFNADEANGLLASRNLYRRIGLPAAYRLVVPSRRLEAIALGEWRQKPARVARIPNGIAVELYRNEPARDAIPGLERRAGEIVVGTIAGLRPVKNLPRLVRAFAAMRNRQSRLVIVGTGPESETIAAEARRCRVADRVLMPGFLPNPSEYAGLFDIFALSSDSEQFPISLIEAMAAGLPAVATAVGDVRSIVAADNQPMIVEPGDEAAFTAALDTLAERPDLRRALGRSNRERARADYDEERMIAMHLALYRGALGDPEAFA